jgi:hypothetical protein
MTIYGGLASVFADVGRQHPHLISTAIEIARKLPDTDSANEIGRGKPKGYDQNFHFGPGSAALIAERPTRRRRTLARHPADLHFTPYDLDKMDLQGKTCKVKDRFMRVPSCLNPVKSVSALSGPLSQYHQIRSLTPFSIIRGSAVRNGTVITGPSGLELAGSPFSSSISARQQSRVHLTQKMEQGSLTRFGRNAS